MLREQTKVIQIGNVKIGGGNPIAIQSMTNTKTEDVEATVAQILALEAAGCEIIRCTVPTREAALALKEIKSKSINELIFFLLSIILRVLVFLICSFMSSTVVFISYAIALFFSLTSCFDFSIDFSKSSASWALRLLILSLASSITTLIAFKISSAVAGSPVMHTASTDISSSLRAAEISPKSFSKSTSQKWILMNSRPSRIF